MSIKKSRMELEPRLTSAHKHTRYPIVILMQEERHKVSFIAIEGHILTIKKEIQGQYH